VVAAEKSETPIIVDFASGTVRGVKVRGLITDIEQAIGVSRIKKKIEYLEGEPSVVYVILFGNHKIYSHWNAFSYTDPIFKTKEGLGVGSKVADFNRFYGKGRIAESEGPGVAIYYRISDKQFCLETDHIIGEKRTIEAYSNSKVKEIWVW